MQLWSFRIKIQTHASIHDISRAAWNALQPGKHESGYNPFIDWDFLSSLEDSLSVCAETGWTPLHLCARDDDEQVMAAAPLYAKSHSMGEYIFDHSWADACERAGIAYFPKLLNAIPFTPATGPRLLGDQNLLADAMISICHENDLSGAHVNFIDPALQSVLVEKGFLARTDRQFHFFNKGYETFEDFLTALSSRKRKKIRAERRGAHEGISITRLRGGDIRQSDWDHFYSFYLDTSNRKWGRPYLTRAFFELVHERMGDQIILVLASDDDTPFAGALNFVGGDCLYGRHWGALRHKSFLHFELCYYQAIEAAIELKLPRVEAGAQGEHKLARGYEPVTTYSAHYLTHPGLRAAVGDYLENERRAVDQNIDILKTHLPFKEALDGDEKV